MKDVLTSSAASAAMARMAFNTRHEPAEGGVAWSAQNISMTYLVTNMGLGQRPMVGTWVPGLTHGEETYKQGR